MIKKLEGLVSPKQKEVTKMRQQLINQQKHLQEKSTNEEIADDKQRLQRRNSINENLIEIKQPEVITLRNQLRMKNNELAAQEEEFRKKQEQVRNLTGQLRAEERKNVRIQQQCSHLREELDGRGTNVKRKENLNHPEESDVDKATLRKQLRDESAQFRKLEEDFKKMKKRLEMVQEQRDELKKN